MGQVDYVSIAYEAPPLHACPDPFRMITPDQVLTHKNDIEGQIRTAKALNEFVAGKSAQEIACELDFDRTAIYYLLKKNASLIKEDQNYNKIIRVNKLKRIFDNISDEIVPKNVDDVCKITSELRKELEGENNISQSATVNIYNINGERADRFRRKISSSHLPTENPA